MEIVFSSRDFLQTVSSLRFMITPILNEDVGEISR